MAERGFSGSAAGAQVSVLRGHGVFLRSANGISLGKTSAGVLLLPGENRVRFVVDPTTFNSRGVDENIYEVHFIAEPETEYIITGRRGDARLCVWRIQEDSGVPEFSTPVGCAVRPATVKSESKPTAN